MVREREHSSFVLIQLDRPKSVQEVGPFPIFTPSVRGRSRSGGGGGSSRFLRSASSDVRSAAVGRVRRGTGFNSSPGTGTEFRG